MGFIEYYLNQQSRANPDQGIKEKTIKDIEQSLKEYKNWYSESGQEIGLSLGKIDEELLKCLKKILQYSNQTVDPSFYNIEKLEQMKHVVEKYKNRMESL